MRRPRFLQQARVGFPFVVPDPFGHVKARLPGKDYTIWRGYLSQLSSVSAMAYGLARMATFLAGSLMAFVCYLRLKEQEPIYIDEANAIVSITHWLDSLRLYIQFGAVLAVLFESVVVCDEPFGMAYGPQFSAFAVLRLPYYLVVAMLFLTAASISTADLASVIDKYQFEVLFDQLGEYFNTCERDTTRGAANYCVEGSHIGWAVQLVGYARSWLFVFGALAAASGILHVATVYLPGGEFLDKLKMLVIYVTAPTEIDSVEELRSLVDRPLDASVRDYAWVTARWYQQPEINYPVDGAVIKGRVRWATAVRVVVFALYVAVMSYAVNLQLYTGLAKYDWSYAGLNDALTNAGGVCSDADLLAGTCDPLQQGWGVNEASTYAYALKLLPVVLMLFYLTASAIHKMWHIFKFPARYKYTHLAEYGMLFYCGCFAAVEAEKFYSDMEIFDGVTQTFTSEVKLTPTSEAELIMYFNFVMLVLLLVAMVVETVLWGRWFVFISENAKDLLRFFVLNLPYPRILLTLTGGVLFGPLAGLWLTSGRSQWHYPIWGFFVGAIVGFALGWALSFIPARRVLGMPARSLEEELKSLAEDPLRPLITNKIWRIVYPVAVFVGTWATLITLLGIYTEIMTVNFTVGGELKTIGTICSVLGSMAKAIIVMFVKAARLLNPCMNDIEPPKGIEGEAQVGLARDTLNNMWNPIINTTKNGGYLTGDLAYCFINGKYKVDEKPEEGEGFFWGPDSDNRFNEVHKHHLVKPDGTKGLWNQEEYCDGVPLNTKNGPLVWEEKCSAQHKSSARIIPNSDLYGKCASPITGETCGQNTNGFCSVITDATQCKNEVTCRYHEGECKEICACYTYEWAPPKCNVASTSDRAKLLDYLGGVYVAGLLGNHVLCGLTYGIGSSCSASGYCTLPVAKFKSTTSEGFNAACPANSYVDGHDINHYEVTVCKNEGDTYCTEDLKDDGKCDTVGAMFDCTGSDCPDTELPGDFPQNDDMTNTDTPAGFESMPEGCNKAYDSIRETITTNLLRSRNALRQIYSGAGICCDEDGEIGKGECLDVWKETSDDVQNSQGDKLDENCVDNECEDKCNEDVAEATRDGCDCEGARGSCARDFDVSSDTGLTISYNEQCLEDVCKATGATIITAFAVSISASVLCSVLDGVGLILNPWPFGAPIDITGGLCASVAHTIAKAVRIATKAAKKIFEFGKKIGRGIRKMITKRKALVKVVNALRKMIGSESSKLLFKSSMIKAFLPVWMTSFFVVLTGFWRREPRKGGTQSLIVAAGMGIAFVFNVIFFIVFFGIGGLVENASQLTQAVGINTSPQCSSYNGGVTTTVIELCGEDELPEGTKCQMGVNCQEPKSCSTFSKSVVDKPPDYVGCIENADCRWYGNSPPEGTPIEGGTLDEANGYSECPTDPYELDKIEVPCFMERQCPPNPTLSPTIGEYGPHWTHMPNTRCESDNRLMFDFGYTAISMGGTHMTGCSASFTEHPWSGVTVSDETCPVSCIYVPEGQSPDPRCQDTGAIQDRRGLCPTEFCSRVPTEPADSQNYDDTLDRHVTVYDTFGGVNGLYMYEHEFTDFTYGYWPFLHLFSYTRGRAQTAQLTIDRCKEICDELEDCGGFDVSNANWDNYISITKYPLTFFCGFFYKGDCAANTEINGAARYFSSSVQFTDMWIKPGNQPPYEEQTLEVDLCYEPYESNPGQCVYRSRMNDPYFERGVFIAAVDDILSTFSDDGPFTARAEMLEGADMIKWGVFLCALANVVIGLYYAIDWLSDALESFPILSWLVDWSYGNKGQVEGFQKRQAEYRAKLKEKYLERKAKLVKLYQKRKKRIGAFKMPTVKKKKPVVTKNTELSKIKLEKPEDAKPAKPAKPKTPSGAAPEEKPVAAPVAAKWHEAPGDDDIGNAGTEEFGTTFGGWLLALAILFPVLQNMTIAYGTDMGWVDDRVQIESYTNWLGVEVGAPLRVYKFEASNSAQANEALKELSESGIFGEASGGMTVDIDSVDCDITPVGIMFKGLLGPLMAAIGQIDFSGLMPNIEFSDLGIDLSKLNIDLNDLIDIEINGLPDLKRFWSDLFDKLPILAGNFFNMIAKFNLDLDTNFDLFRDVCVEPSKDNSFLKHTCRSQCRAGDTECKDQCRDGDFVCIEAYPIKTALNPTPGPQYKEKEAGQFVRWSGDGVQDDEPCRRDSNNECVPGYGLFDGKFTRDVVLDNRGNYVSGPCPKKCLPGIPYYSWEFWLLNFLPIVYCILVFVGTLLSLTMPSTRRPPWEPPEKETVKVCGITMRYDTLDNARVGTLDAIRALLLPIATTNVELIVAIIAIIEMFGEIDAVLFTFHVDYGEGATNALVSSSLMMLSALVLNVNRFWPVDG